MFNNNLMSPRKILVPVRKRVYFSSDDDLHLLREVAAQNPYEEASRWGLIQGNMTQITGKFFTERSIKDRVQNLITKFAEKIQQDEFKSGVEEPITEIDDLLHAILSLMNEFKNKKSKKKRAAADSSSQKGFKKREEATQNLKYSLNVDEENLSFVNEVEVISNQDNIQLEVVDHDYDNTIQNLVQNTLVNQENNDFHNQNKTLKKLNTPNKSVEKGTRGNVMTPSRVRSGGLKQSSIKFLEKKNDRWYEVRCRELKLQEKQFELESYERKKRLEIEERRLLMDEKRLEMEEMKLKTELDIFKNQQNLMEMAFRACNRQD